MNNKLDIRPVLFLSTAHLSGPSVADAFAYPLEYGWLWNCGDGCVDESLPDCLRDCYAFAKAHGVEIIRFDCDSATAEGLPTYDW